MVGGSSGRKGGLVFCLLCAMLSACSTSRPQPQPPSRSSIIGVASWYGPGFNGQSTASGEIYDQDDLTAASGDYRLGTRVMVTNLDNGRSLAVRINDRGPFVKGRVLDLSRGAARLLGIVEPGTARVRVDVIGGPQAARLARRVPGYWVQVGSFGSRFNAERLRSRLAAVYSDVRTEQVEAGGDRYYRVRMGSFATREQAERRAVQSADLGLSVLIVSNE